MPAGPQGSLTGEQHADAVVAADVATHVVLALQANAPPGQLAVAPGIKRH